MDDDLGIDVGRSAAALNQAGLMPPVVALHVEDDARGADEVLVVEILLPSPDDAAVRIARVLPSVRYELRYVALDEDGRRPGVTYASKLNV